jgi:hypothetical protein
MRCGTIHEPTHRLPRISGPWCVGSLFNRIGCVFRDGTKGSLAEIFSLGDGIVCHIAPIRTTNRRRDQCKYDLALGIFAQVGWHSCSLRKIWLIQCSVPVGVVALVLLIICMPNNFPHHFRDTVKSPRRLGSVDGVGAGLMLTGILLLITGFEEASNFTPWVSARVLAPILSSSPVFVIFVCYERFVTLRKSHPIEPVFPWRFCRSRVIGGIFM